jgi:hypothetical protein
MSNLKDLRQMARPVHVMWLALLIILIVLLVAQLPVLIDLLSVGVVYEDQGITDLGRDLIGAAVAEQGGMPYQQVGDLMLSYQSPDLPLSGPPRPTGWVVHPPLALAGARALLVAFDADAEMVGRRLGVLALAALVVAIIVVLRRRKPSWSLPAAIAMLVWVPTFTDTVWIQSNAFAGLGLLAVVLLDDRGRWTMSRVILGLLVAWKPWLMVFALALPRSSSVVKDLAVVAVTAGAATLLALPFVGGLESLWTWITEAMPGNAVEARNTPSNVSWTSFAGTGWATGLYLGAALAIPMIRRWVPRDAWLLIPVWVATALAPFVWDHYWLALAPIVWLVVSEIRPEARVLAGVWMGLAVLPVALSRLGQSGLENRVMPMVLAGAALFFALVLHTRSVTLGRGREPTN